MQLQRWYNAHMQGMFWLAMQLQRWYTKHMYRDVTTYICTYLHMYICVTYTCHVSGIASERAVMANEHSLITGLAT